MVDQEHYKNIVNGETILVDEYIRAKDLETIEMIRVEDNARAANDAAFAANARSTKRESEI